MHAYIVHRVKAKSVRSAQKNELLLLLRVEWWHREEDCLRWQKYINSTRLHLFYNLSHPLRPSISILAFAGGLVFAILENGFGFVKILLNGAILDAYPVICSNPFCVSIEFNFSPLCLRFAHCTPVAYTFLRIIKGSRLDFESKYVVKIVVSSELGFRGLGCLMMENVGQWVLALADVSESMSWK